jgi:hypothetical protein
MDNSTSCEIRAVNCFLHAKNMIAVEIHCELCVVYSQNVMSEGTVRQWCSMFIVKSEVVGHLYWVMILFKMLTKQFVKDGDSQFQNFCVNFLKFHALFSMRLSQLG